ncbi:MAG: T9SS type A sorting domain-containing protein [Candidatus Eisenbacteria bacterium]|nr:T9SS type A sorting domain-containing protein [Candidatus Eisenbacteria bacterium]MBU1950217.1 T9SS type A sorting domain-containing protein [Candidatus Eisenbacteria bacterium]
MDNMLSGTTAGQGNGYFNLYQAPAGYAFVLTDFAWIWDSIPTGDYDTYTKLLSDTEEKWSWWTESEAFGVGISAETHWNTGILFAPDNVVKIEILGLNPSINWHAYWSGYLRSTAPADVGESIHPLPDQQILTSPNPSGDLSNLDFSLTQSDHVIVAVFDVQGRKIRTLHEGQLPQGAYSMPWDGTDDQGNAVSDGIYFTRIETAEKTSVGKLTRVR